MGRRIPMLVVSMLLIAALSASAQSNRQSRGRGMPGQMETEEGLLVTGISTDSPAERAGLMRGDILVAIEDVKVSSPAELRDALSDLRAGQRVELEITRGGEPKTINLTLEDRLNRPVIGLEFAKGPRVFDMGMIHGVLVDEVIGGSPADRAGLKEGDIIVAIDGDEVHPGAFAAAIQAREPGDKITFTVERRDAEAAEKTVTLGEGADDQTLLGVRYHAGPMGLGSMDDHRGRMGEMHEHMENQPGNTRPWRSTPAPTDQDA